MSSRKRTASGSGKPTNLFIHPPSPSRTKVIPIVDLELEEDDFSNKRTLRSKKKIKDKLQVLPESTPTRKKAASPAPTAVSQLLRLHAAAKTESIRNKNILSPGQKEHKGKGSSWVERNYPKSVQELFVNTRKIQEVQNWMKSAIEVNDKQHSRRSKICVLTGPTGAGKTATLFLLAKEMNIEIKEWINPSSLNEFSTDRLGKFDPEEVQTRNQFDLFSNFLFRASQYSTLKIKGRENHTKKIIVVEDFPNIFYRDAEMFKNSILRPYASIGVFPVVFVIADSASRDSNVNTLFPKTILQELNIGYISLNAVAPSYMTKFLEKVCSKEGVSAGRTLIESVATASGGDIRCAINTLEFKLSTVSKAADSHDIFKRPPKTISKNKSKGKDKTGLTTDDVAKDETLFLFRALGKILYSKRCNDNCEINSEIIPNTAVGYLRSNALQEIPEELVNKIEVPADSFLNFLQQNYIPFFGSMDDIVVAASILSDSEFILSRWAFDDSGTVSKSYKEHENREEVSLLIASRGLMYANVKKTPNTWRPLKKPMFGDVRTKTQKSLEDLRQSFPSEGAIRENFYSEVIPFYAKLALRKSRPWTPNQFALIREVGSITKGFKNRFHDTLQERDAVVDPMSDDDDEECTNENEKEKKISSHTSNFTTNVVDDDEEFEIEEYED